MKPRATHIRRLVAIEFGVDEAMLECNDHHPKFSIPRQVVMYLTYERTRHGYYAIGKILHRHHTTVMHGVRRTRERIANDREIAARVNRIRDKLDAMLRDAA